jgi:hypothetical protein
MEHEGSLPCSSKYTTGPYDSLFESTVRFYTPSKIQFNIILPSRRWPVKPLNVFRQEIVYIFHFLPLARSAGLPSCNKIIDYEVLH